MAHHSSTLAWRVPWMEAPGGLKSMGLQRVGHHGVIMNKCKKSKLYGTRPRVQLFSGVQLFETPWTAMYKDFLSITNSQRLLKPMSIALVMPSNHLILCPPFLSSIWHSIRVFFFYQWVSSSHQVPKVWSWSFSISPSNKYSRFTSFRIDWSCSPRDSQECSQTPQFKSISSLALSYLYGPNSHIHACLLEKQ